MFKSRRESGFTLVEMIGVMAVIAILASVATPRIIDAIEDAKISSLVQQTKTLESAVAKFYADTGSWPTNYIYGNNPDHIIESPHYHQLMVNASDSSGTLIRGWQGPYIEKEPANIFSRLSTQYLVKTSDTNYICDVDGDGELDGAFMTYRIDGVTDKHAEKISNIFDGDGGSTDWKAKGRVKRYGGNHDSYLIICLARI